MDDLARACLRMLNHYSEDEIVNIGFGSDVSILELTTMVQEVVGYRGRIVWDSSKPDGTYRKLLQSDRIRNLGWQPEVDLKEGMKAAYEDYVRRAATPVTARSDEALVTHSR